MKRTGEVITASEAEATVRVCRVRHGVLHPTSLIVRAKCTSELYPGDIAKLDIHIPLFAASSLCAYMMPLCFAALAFFIAGRFTDSLLIMECAALPALFLSYAVSAFLSSRRIFRNTFVCTAEKTDIN